MFIKVREKIMKKLYLFMLGRDPELAIAEIESYFFSHSIPFRILNSSSVAAAVELDDFIDDWIDEFGGVIKVCEVVSNSSRLEIIEKELSKIEWYSGSSNKITYFVDAYETEIDDFVIDYLKGYFKSNKIKGMLKKDSYPSRLIKKNTITDGLEVVVYRNYAARTIAVSNPLLLKERDLGRPRTDYLKTISLRLAKILINLSCVKAGDTLVDPFCGCGGILQEAVLKGINAIGVDNDSNAVNESRLNMEWLAERYKFNGRWKVIKGDSSMLSKIIDNRCDGIATEPYLGPYIKKMPNLFQAKGMMSELTSMYSKVISESFKILAKGCRAAIVVPKFRTIEGKKVSMNFRAIAENSGFFVIYGPIEYAYKESKLLREIWVIEKR